jgi:hypothetical protein
MKCYEMIKALAKHPPDADFLFFPKDIAETDAVDFTILPPEPGEEKYGILQEKE